MSLAVLDYEELQSSILEKIGEITGINFCLSIKSLNKFTGEIPEERIVSRILSDETTGKYNYREEDGDDIGLIQANISNVVIALSFRCSKQIAKECHKFFNHNSVRFFTGSETGSEYIVVEVSSLIPLDDIINGHYVEKSAFDLTVRVEDDYKMNDTKVTDIEFELKEKEVK